MRKRPPLKNEASAALRRALDLLREPDIQDSRTLALRLLGLVADKSTDGYREARWELLTLPPLNSAREYLQAAYNHTRQMEKQHKRN